MPKKIAFNLSSDANIPLQTRYGLYEVGDKLYLDGKEFKGIGVNHYGYFLRQYRENKHIKFYSTNEDDLQHLSSNGIKIIRSSFGFDDYISWLKYYHLNKVDFWDYVKKCLDDLASYDMGCICVMNWSMRMFSDSMFYSNKWVVEYPSDLFNPKKFSYNFLKSYISEFVSRFWNHPAIYAWEITNEVSFYLGLTFNKNWGVDGSVSQYINWGNHPNGQPYPKTAKVYLENYMNYVPNFISLIKGLDPHKRVVFSGGGVESNYMINAILNSTATSDTLVQRNGLSQFDNIPFLNYIQKSFDGICVHIYPEEINQCKEQNWNINQYIKQCKSWSNQSGKPMILEEFGANYLNGGVANTKLLEEQYFWNMMNEIETSNIPLSLLWNYSGYGTTIANSDEWTVTDPSRIYQFNAICELNDKIKI